MVLLPLLLLACAPTDSKTPADPGGSGSTTTTTTTTTTTDPSDPHTLAGQVSQDEIGATIQALEDFGSRNVRAEPHDEAMLWLADRFEALGYVVEEDTFEAAGLPATNLIARLDGQDPSTVWIFSAHYDSTSTDREHDAPGADDNASGVAAVLEAARLLRDVPLRHSVWFVLTDAEEEGSLGSAHMADWLSREPVEVRGVIAPDMIGYWPLGDGDAFDILGDTASEPLVLGMAEVADELGVAYKIWIDHDYCYGDDHTMFQEAGIPALSPMDCVEAHNLRTSPEDTPHYHQTSDTLDTLHLPFTASVTGVIVATLARWAG